MSQPMAVVLAAGRGTRMKSDLPKVLFPVLGRAMIHWVLDALEAAQAVSFSTAITSGADLMTGFAVLDDFVVLVRAVAGGADFPASFDSREQWRRTLAIGYDWLRIAGYLDGRIGHADMPGAGLDAMMYGDR